MAQFWASVGQASLRGRNANRTRLDAHGLAKGASERLEAYLDHVVQDFPAVHHDVQVALSSARESFEEDWSELDVPRSKLGPARERHLPNEVHTPREIERSRRPRLVHGQRRGPVTHDPDLVAGGFGEGLTDDQSQVLGRMMAVDLDVARCSYAEVDEAVTGDLLNHVRQKGQGSLDIATAGSVEIEC